MPLLQNQSALGAIPANSTVYAVAEVVMDETKQQEYYASLSSPDPTEIPSNL